MLYNLEHRPKAFVYLITSRLQDVLNCFAVVQREMHDNTPTHAKIFREFGVIHACMKHFVGASTQDLDSTSKNVTGCYVRPLCRWSLAR